MSKTDKQLPLTNEAVAALAAQKYAEADSTEREAFLADPKGALEKTAGFAFDAGIEVRAVHNTADEVHVGIPAYHTLPPQGGRIPLDQDVLDNVAGGGGAGPIRKISLGNGRYEWVQQLAPGVTKRWNYDPTPPKYGRGK